MREQLATAIAAHRYQCGAGGQLQAGPGVDQRGIHGAAQPCDQRIDLVVRVEFGEERLLVGAQLVADALAKQEFRRGVHGGGGVGRGHGWK
ncbi:hypothetical protein D3C87_1736570 [compost metagenome]